ncbi:hypothetical protein JTB14_001969 [Gonioctena quinquepunctata]|nr:hypothetical protein JTB14_001969 [Gonioctena quinquepunctata]
MVESNSGPSEDQTTRKLGPSVKVCQINIEGISRANCQILHKILLSNDIDVVAIQETHTENEHQLTSRRKIYGYDLMEATYHKAYGTATYVRSDIGNACLKSTSSTDSAFEIVVHVGNISINSIYKPPNTQWPPQVVQASRLAILTAIMSYETMKGAMEMANT